MDKLSLILRSGQLKGSIRLPGSKSISNRLLVMIKLAESNTVFENLSTADDTIRLLKSLNEIETCYSSRIPMIVDAGNAGTVFRFLTAYLSVSEGKWLLTGTERMKKRPVGGLVKALNELGADIVYTGDKNYPPLRIEGSELQGNSVRVKASKSSQFVTALMLIAPYLENGLVIELKQKPVSFSYIKMTASLMNQFGAHVRLEEKTISIKQGNYKLKEMYVEPDWSSASYWYEIVALSNDADIFLTGFVKNSIQCDSICADLFKQLGVNTTFKKDGIRLQSAGKLTTSFEFDFTDYPDLVPAVAVTCTARQIPATFNGISHLKYKESDRLNSMSKELLKIGTKLEIGKGSLKLAPSKSFNLKKKTAFDTHGDHRIAMSLAPLVLKFKELTINDPDVVTKSYPGFWEDIKSIGLADVEKIKSEL